MLHLQIFLSHLVYTLFIKGDSLTELEVEYINVIVDSAVYLYTNRNNVCVVSKVEGERSATFKIGIPETIKLALPLPRIKVGEY